MEVYILDELFRRETLIDRFESMIWTERGAILGDFEMVIHSNNESRSLLVPGTYLAINESYRIMKIETLEDTKDSEGRSQLTASGRSLEMILLDRVASEGVHGFAENPNWFITGTPGNIARFVFRKIVREGLLNPGDTIPFLQEGTIMPPSTIAEPDVEETMEIPVSSVYDVIKNICDIHGLSFRLVRGLDTSKLYFDIYTGIDRTTAQNDFAPVIFSQDLDNLSDVTELTSTAQFKNVAYVFTPIESLIVYADNVDPAISGFERRVMFVEANDIDEETPPDDIIPLMRKRGLDALAKQKNISAIDGTLPQNSKYKYGTHYQLGDLVEMRNADGVTNNMRVTEQIFVSDVSGERSYPTLTNDLYITPGSWLAWDSNGEWDYAEGVWDDQP